MAKKGGKGVDLSFLQGEGARTDLSGMFAASVSETQQATPIKLDRLTDNPYQPRLDMDDSGLDDLAGVIRTQGFQGVLVARPHPQTPGLFQLTAGHRRREAARRAGLTSLPIIVRELTDEEMVVLAITENIQREDLSPLEEGKIYLLMGEELGYTHEQIAREVGKNRGYVENRIRVARAPDDVQRLVMLKPDSLRAVATLIKIKDPERRADIITQMLAGTLTADDLPGYLEAGTGPGAGTATTTGRPRGRTPPPASRPLGQLGPEAERRAQERIGNGKLVAALRNLTNYLDTQDSREQISMREYANLLQLRRVVNDLCTRWEAGEREPAG